MGKKVLADLKHGEYAKLAGNTLFRVAQLQAYRDFSQAAYVNVVLYPGTVVAIVSRRHPATPVFDAPEWNKES